jgi:hypothetical protein
VAEALLDAIAHVARAAAQADAQERLPSLLAAAEDIAALVQRAAPRHEAAPASMSEPAASGASPAQRVNDSPRRARGPVAGAGRWEVCSA